jgi:hypothetical protein
MKTVIEMAREAGLFIIGTADGSEAVYTWPKGITEELERFAELVRADEREACAKHAEDFLTRGRSPLGHAVGDAIRARGVN